jgi:radical SAM protein with 4Fe4S-binding SPASM domain
MADRSADPHATLDRYSVPQWLGDRAVRRFHVMAKPAGSACNLDCSYCFCLGKQELPGGPSGGHMHDDVLERFVHDYIDSVTGDEVVFSWQGGEPTLMGLDFFRKAVALQKAFETTAPQHWDEAGLPIVGDPRTRPDHADSVVTAWSVDAEEYGYFLSRVWDEWLARDAGKVLVNFCETLVVQRMGMPSQICVYSGYCGKGVALEHDGSVYACDHYVYPEYRLGSLRQQSLGDMVFSPRQVRFGYSKSERLPRYCRNCEFLADCGGECPKNRLLRALDQQSAQPSSHRVRSRTRFQRGWPCSESKSESSLTQDFVSWFACGSRRSSRSNAGSTSPRRA